MALLVLSAAALRAAPAPPTPAPAPALDPARLVVPLGEARTVKWKNATGAPQVFVADPAVAGAEVAGATLRVQGLAPGETTVDLEWAGRTVTLPVSVRPWAARFPKRLDVAVTGGPLGPPAFEEALRRALWGAAALHPRAGVSVTFVKPPKADGEAPVRLAASGAGLLGAETTIPVRFTTSKVDLYPSQATAVSNRPERVKAEGVLLQRDLPAGPTRLLVHHRNEPGHPERYLETLLTNRTASPARVLLILAAVGPSQDEIFAGHLASARFLERLLERRGVVLRLAPGQSVLVDRIRMKTGQTVSAMGWIQPLDGLPVEVTVRSTDVEGNTVAVDLAEPGAGPFSTGRGVFPGWVEASYAYDVGSRFLFIPLGEGPVTDLATGEILPGNFGVVYRLRLLLRNPTAEPREAWVDFTARGGPARGLFYLDDAFVETPLGTYGSPVRLGRWTLQPGEEREVLVETFPQSGSNYPVQLVVQSQYLELPSRPHPTDCPPLPVRWLP